MAVTLQLVTTKRTRGTPHNKTKTEETNAHQKAPKPTPLLQRKQKAKPATPNQNQKKTAPANKKKIPEQRMAFNSSL
jgi:hypothetical protein